jgi:hypothetical protein
MSVAPSENLKSGQQRSEHENEADRRQQSMMENVTGKRRFRKPRWLQKKRHLKLLRQAICGFKIPTIKIPVQNCMSSLRPIAACHTTVTRTSGPACVVHPLRMPAPSR